MPSPKNTFFNDTALYEVQRVGNHCVALVNKKDVQKTYPDFDFHALMPPSGEPAQAQDKMITKWKKPHEFNEKIAAWDIETSKDEIKQRARALRVWHSTDGGCRAGRKTVLGVGLPDPVFGFFEQR